MNIELDEVVVLDVSDDALEMAAGGAQGGPKLLLPCTAVELPTTIYYNYPAICCTCQLSGCL